MMRQLSDAERRVRRTRLASWARKAARSRARQSRPYQSRPYSGVADPTWLRDGHPPVPHIVADLDELEAETAVASARAGRIQVAHGGSAFGAAQPTA